MQRKWRSASWRAAHPLGTGDALRQRVQNALMPLRRFVGRFALPPTLTHMDMATRFVVGQDVEGDYCEFGVYTGRTFVEAFRQISTLERSRGSKHRRRFFAFDSFEGLPTLGDTDKVYEQFSVGEYSATKAEFIANLQENGVDLNRVIIEQGWFDQTLTPATLQKHRLSQVSLAMIDCDLYESTVPVLDFLTDLLVDGAVIIFDDWLMYRGNPKLGLQKAFYEWSARHPQLSFSDLPSPFYYGQKAFIVHRADV